MFFAHLPAGYLVGRGMLKTGSATLQQARQLMLVALVAGIAPDFDLLYFYLVDSSKSHHFLWPHIPFFWLPLAILAGLLKLAGRDHLSAIALTAFLSVMLHLLLDSVAGGIFWLWPFSQEVVVIQHVPAKYQFWIANFILHWTFLLELFVIAVAMIVYLGGRKRVSRLSVSEEPGLNSVQPL